MVAQARRVDEIAGGGGFCLEVAQGLELESMKSGLKTVLLMAQV